MNTDYAHTPDEVAALPEVQQACDDLVWETNERERCDEFCDKHLHETPYGRAGVIFGWLAAKRDAVNQRSTEDRDER